MQSGPPAMQIIEDKVFCKFTGALFQHVITNDDGKESESIGTNTASYLLFMVVKYGLTL